MDHSKRNVHSSGALGMLIKSGHIKKILPEEITPEAAISSSQEQAPTPVFRTQAGLTFNAQELIYIDPQECEPWLYANRRPEEMELDELILSIKENKQLQPVLVRPHPKPHDNIKYEIIFGRRRHLACLRLGIPLLAIKKNISNLQEAIASQDAENKFRKNVSNFSNSLLYKRLLNDKVFKSEKELAEKLGLSTSTLNDLMSYAKIPEDIVQKLPDIHQLSTSLAIKIVALINTIPGGHEKMLMLAPQIGKSLSSPVKLEKAFHEVPSDKTKEKENSTQVFKKRGKRLFTFKLTHTGAPCVVINRDIVSNMDYEAFCHHIYQFLDAHLEKSGAPEVR